MNLFKSGFFELHSGEESKWIIDCEALTDDDLETLADLAAKLVGPFSDVEGVPNGGLRFARALRKRQTHGSSGRLLIADDVYTTGASMEARRRDRDTIGVVIFARRWPPPWISYLFKFNTG